MGKLSVFLYEKRYKKPAPDYVKDYSILSVVLKPVKKWLTNTVAANTPFGGLRIFLYRLCGFKIGKHVTIGMRCYLDDHCTDMLTVEDYAVISYGVYFTCHGANQPHTPIVIKERAYIGMRANIVSGKSGVTIGKGAVVGACTLVLKDVPDGATMVGVPGKVIKTKQEGENE